jgi:hypothetical protein
VLIEVFFSVHEKKKSKKKNKTKTTQPNKTKESKQHENNVSMKFKKIRESNKKNQIILLTMQRFEETTRSNKYNNKRKKSTCFILFYNRLFDNTMKNRGMFEARGEDTAKVKATLNHSKHMAPQKLK